MIEHEHNFIRQAQQGDQQAFQHLVNIYGQPGLRLACAFLLNRQQAEDCVQEAGLDAWQHLAQFDLAQPFKPWLATLIINRCKMALRSPHHRQNLGSLSLDGNNDTPHVQELYALPEPFSAVEGRLVVNELINRLPPPQQQILALRFYADLRLEEIAELLKLPTSTVKSRLYRAMETLRNSVTHQS